MVWLSVSYSVSLPRCDMGCYAICGCVVNVAFHGHAHLIFDITTLVFVPCGCRNKFTLCMKLKAGCLAFIVLLLCWCDGAVISYVSCDSGISWSFLLVMVSHA